MVREALPVADVVSRGLCSTLAARDGPCHCGGFQCEAADWAHFFVQVTATGLPLQWGGRGLLVMLCFVLGGGGMPMGPWDLKTGGRGSRGDTPRVSCGVRPL